MHDQLRIEPGRARKHCVGTVALPRDLNRYSVRVLNRFRMWLTRLNGHLFVDEEPNES